LQQESGIARYNFSNGAIGITNESFAKMLDIDASKITAVNMIWMHQTIGVGPKSDNFDAEFNEQTTERVVLGYAICGTFEGGTFPCLPGVYLYSCDDNAFLSYDAEDVTLPDGWRDFSKLHNGIAMAFVCPARWLEVVAGDSALTGRNEKGNFLFLIGKDGAYYDFAISVKNKKPTLAPFLFFKLDFAGKIKKAVSFDKTSRLVNDIVQCSLLDVANMERGGNIDVYCNTFSAVNYYTNASNGTSAGTSAIFEIYVLIVSKDSPGVFKLLNINTTLTAFTQENNESVSRVARYGGSIDGNNTINLVKTYTLSEETKFELEKVSPSASDCFVLCGSILRDGRKVPAYIDLNKSELTDPVEVLSGEVYDCCCSAPMSFSTVKTDTNASGTIPVYRYSFSVGAHSFFVLRKRGTVDVFVLAFKTSEGEWHFTSLKSFNPVSLCVMPMVDCSVLIGTSAKSYKYATSVLSLEGEDTTAGQGIAYGKAVSGKAISGDSIGLSSEEVLPCASFVIRADKKDVLKNDDGGLNVVASVDVVQLTTCAALIPFALPKWDVRYVRLNWENLTFTEGAKLNVWVKEEFVDEYPDLKNFAFYDVSQRSVDGWTLVGVIDASESGAVNMPLKVRGKVATFLLTAYVGAPDDLKDGTPVGVGNVDVDIFNSKIYNAGTGWKPSITLLG
jgi:hypothetical protein